MGMFDSVMVPCPNCGTTNEFQSKGGDCVLATYSLEDAPFNVLGDVNRWPVSCRRCGTGYRVEVVATAWPVGDGSSMSDVNEIADELRRLPYGHRAYEAADEIERLQARVRELRELLAVVNGDGGHHAQAVGTRQAVEDAIAAYHALQDRVQELEAAVREYLQAEGSSGDLGIRDDRYVVRQRLLTAVSAEEKKEKQ